VRPSYPWQRWRLLGRPQAADCEAAESLSRDVWRWCRSNVNDFVRQKEFYAQGRLKTGQMDKSEAAYAAFLESEKHAGRVLWYRFEGLKLRLADNTFYTPDFAVLASDADGVPRGQGFLARRCAREDQDRR